MFLFYCSFPVPLQWPAQFPFIENIIFCWINILGDPGADSGGKRKSKRAEKYGTKKSKERREASSASSDFSPRLDFLLPPLSAPGSPRINGDGASLTETPLWPG